MEQGVGDDDGHTVFVDTWMGTSSNTSPVKSAHPGGHARQ